MYLHTNCKQLVFTIDVVNIIYINLQYSEQSFNIKYKLNL